ncbi:MAG: L,D-transpeptidase family protein [Calditrichaeota bacterium]|nr:L,D-transpeptidase family protein [Calditrichota bacterium]MCB9367051.1 L,D-transpeptidase family protein [Calditrichota bacterium]MCB9391465.1 L,D-transpeptidase family protein [Calditrichota bacterium]
MPRYLTFAALLLIVVWFSGCDTPPLADMVRAESALNRCRSNVVKKYATDELEAGEVALQKAREELAYQQGRWSALRSYDSADSLIAFARTLIQLAEDSAATRRAKAFTYTKTELTDLDEDLALWRKSLNDKLTLYRAEKLWTLSQMSLATAHSLLRQDDIDGARDAAQECREQLAALRDVINNHDVDEQERIRMSRSWVTQTIEQSKRNGSTAIIVDKEEKLLHLIKDGKKTKSYRCDLGFNAAYQKMFSGDGATPEGRYHVTKVNNASRYFKALLLNYPNDDDKKRFAANKRAGRISQRAGIGRLIEIHGHGGQNKDWTDGCVALADRDMLELLSHATVGTPVTIVRKLERFQ